MARVKQDGECYVYCLLDPRKPGPFKYGRWTFSHEPLYVGKGSGTRAYDHLYPEAWNYNPFKGRVIAKIQQEGTQPIVLIKKSNLFEADAHKLEIAMITKIGRRNLKTGPLVNLTNGGEGLLGHKVSKKRDVNAQNAQNRCGQICHLKDTKNSVRNIKNVAEEITKSMQQRLEQ